MVRYTTVDGDVLDLICWRYYGRTSGALEAVLGANRGLAARGAVYPAGVVIELPALAPGPTPPPDGRVRLWD